MISDTINSMLVSELSKLNSRQLSEFVWRCSVRCLPFLGKKGNFNFWKDSERQKHLFSIFYALDSIVFHSTDTTNELNALRSARLATESYDFNVIDAIISAILATGINSRRVHYARNTAIFFFNEAAENNINVEPVIFSDLNVI